MYWKDRIVCLLVSVVFGRREKAYAFFCCAMPDSPKFTHANVSKVIQLSYEWTNHILMNHYINPVLSFHDHMCLPFTLHDHTDSPFLSSGPRVVHDPLRSPDAEGPESAASDVLRDLLVQKRHVLLSKLQSQVMIFFLPFLLVPLGCHYHFIFLLNECKTFTLSTHPLCILYSPFFSFVFVLFPIFVAHSFFA